MLNYEKSKRIKMGDTVTYRICVQGYLEDVWSDRLANMTIQANVDNKESPETELVGIIKDQSELLGVLNSLYELRFPILYLAVELIE
ncbi:hypothetical protein [Desulforhopalus sp. 52FAK]